METQNLDEFFDHDEPFGPTNAAYIEDENIFRKILDPNNKIIERIRPNVSLIVGRKGSGKTSFLRSLAKSKLCENINTADTFSYIVESIDEKSSSFVFVERISQLWENIFFLSLFRTISTSLKSPEKEIRLLKDYCAKYDIGPDVSIEDWIWKILKTAKDKASNTLISSVAAFMSEIAGEDFDGAKKCALSILKYNKERATVLIDSLEGYPTNVPTVAHALAGLLHCVGEFNQRNKWINIRLCLPAEMYHSFNDISVNPLKDFSNCVILHWHPTELLRIAANRLNIFLSINYPKLYRDCEHFDHKEAQAFLCEFLPEKIINGLEEEEETVPYILRHTQLMPRQLLRILNSIFEEAYVNGTPNYPVVDSASVVTGIRKQEPRIADEVCSAFRNKYPNLKKVCEKTINKLPIVFSNGQLHEVFNRHGKKVFGSDDFDDYKRMLIEAAVIGRVIKKENEKYIHGKFEYTAAHKLITSDDDELCLHPIFARVFRYKRSDQKLAIYPYGTDPNSEDYRDSYLWT